MYALTKCTMSVY